MSGSRPSRSTKVSEKLVLIPETEDADSVIEEKDDFDEDNETEPIRDDEETMRKTGGRKGKSYAERLPKARREEKLARVTAYCTAQAYKLKATAQFLRERHKARAKLYDDCLYVVYHLPILPGENGCRVRSSPEIRSKGGKTLLDEEIERSEGRDYVEGFFEGDDPENYRVLNEDESPHTRSPRSGSPRRDSQDHQLPDSSPDKINHHHNRQLSPNRQSVQNALRFGEMYIFSYGVAVFWNFTAQQEKSILADLTFSTPSSPPSYSSSTDLSAIKSPTFAPPCPTTIPTATSSSPLVLSPSPPTSFETEAFHFEYSPSTPRPRIYNDMITLRSGDHMLKLTISHAIAQSTKLSVFESRLESQMKGEALAIPRRLALRGDLGMKREEVVRILGSLFKSRVDVNLSSNILEVPRFFWDAEPTLHPLYVAVREYLEIKPRIQVLNERCRVFLDLAEILSDGIADNKMSRLTWIIIVLILISIFVTTSEVFLRFGILSTRGGGGGVGRGAGVRALVGMMMGEGRNTGVMMGGREDDAIPVCRVPDGGNLTVSVKEWIAMVGGNVAEL